MPRETQRKGDIAKAKAIATFTRLGFDVAILITESAAYDLIVDNGTNLHRVQVKYCGSANRNLDFRNIHSNAKGYVVKIPRANAYDWLYVLDSEGNEYLYTEGVYPRNSVRIDLLPKMES